MNPWLALAFVSAASPAWAQSEADLRAADVAQQAAARANDGEALIAMAHENFRLFAPEGYIGHREGLRARFAGPETGYVRFDRTIEAVTVTGTTGVVMGRETIARKDGAAVARRFTNVWLYDRGRWRWLARDASVISE